MSIIWVVPCNATYQSTHHKFPSFGSMHLSFACGGSTSSIKFGDFPWLISQFFKGQTPQFKTHRNGLSPGCVSTNENIWQPRNTSTRFCFTRSPLVASPSPGARFIVYLCIVYILYADYMHIICVLYLNYMCIIFELYVYYMCIICVLCKIYVYYMYGLCIFNVYCMCIVCVLHVYYVFLYVYNFI